jgi:hypothetical protein
VSLTRTLTGTPTTLYPAVSFYGPTPGSATFNFGALPFSYSVPAGYDAGVCQ